MKSLRSLLGLRVQGADGKLGRLQDVYFDDRAWRVEFLMICRGRFPACCFLASPDRIVQRSTDRVMLSLSKSEAKNAAGADSVETVTEHERKLLRECYGISDVTKYPGRWQPHEAIATQEEVETAAEELHDPKADRSLRSLSEFLDYLVQVREGDAGTVDDLLVGEDDWLVNYIVVNTKGYATFPQKILVRAEWVESISWEQSTASLDSSLERLQSCQRYNPASHAH